MNSHWPATATPSGPDSTRRRARRSRWCSGPRRIDRAGSRYPSIRRGVPKRDFRHWSTLVRATGGSLRGPRWRDLTTDGRFARERGRSGPSRFGRPDPRPETRACQPTRGVRMNADPVDEQGEESFPASDPPEGWAGPDGPRVAGVGEEPEG